MKRGINKPRPEKRGLPTMVSGNSFITNGRVAWPLNWRLRYLYEGGVYTLPIGWKLADFVKGMVHPDCGCIILSEGGIDYV